MRRSLFEVLVALALAGVAGALAGDAAAPPGELKFSTHNSVYNAEGSFGESAVLEYEYDLAAGTGTKVLDYRSGNSSGAFGDAHRLPNGNTFITYSTAGVWHEIDAAGTLLREMTTDGLGYSQHRKTLYGPPPI